MNHYDNNNNNMNNLFVHFIFFFLQLVFSEKKIRVFLKSTTFLNLIQAESTFRYTGYPFLFLLKSVSLCRESLVDRVLLYLP